MIFIKFFTNFQSCHGRWLCAALLLCVSTKRATLAVSAEPAPFEFRMGAHAIAPEVFPGDIGRPTAQPSS